MINLKNMSPRILVIGDLIVDQYLWGECERVSPEAPVQIISVNDESTVLGGAGNVVNNLKELGAQVDVISVVGSCKISNQLLDLLEDINIKSKYLVIEHNRKSSKKSRIIASHQQVVRYDRESAKDINLESQNAIIENFEKIVLDYDTILLSDYGKGVLTDELTKSLIKIANKNNKKVLIDPKGTDYSKYEGAYLLTPNKQEASEATKINILDDANLEKALIKLKSLCNLEISLITLSDEGIAVYDDTLRIHPTKAKEVFDVTGAGDTVLATLGFAIACDFRIDEAIEFSNLAGGVVIGKIGSATASIDEIIAYNSNLNKPFVNKIIQSQDEISKIIDNIKIKGEKIVFTNGCFDLIHAGHINFLASAKSLGDILIVGLNSDESVSILKGNERPINSQKDRAYILAALEMVDYVIVFNEETPYSLIETIKPNVLAKGSDYKNKEVVGEDLVENVQLIDFVFNTSSSKTINKIKLKN